MNKQEYNRKMKSVDRDIDKAIDDVTMAKERRIEAWRKKDALRRDGWTE